MERIAQRTVGCSSQHRAIESGSQPLRDICGKHSQGQHGSELTEAMAKVTVETFLVLDVQTGCHHGHSKAKYCMQRLRAPVKTRHDTTALAWVKLSFPLMLFFVSRSFSM